MNDNKYNGWTNYETWNVALWLDNDEGSCGYWAEQADAAVERADKDKDEAVERVGRQLQQEVNDSAPDLGASCFADLLSAAMSEVNWYEIAEHYVSEALERVSEDVEA